jgi:hypothetical protein
MENRLSVIHVDRCPSALDPPFGGIQGEPSPESENGSSDNGEPPLHVPLPAPELHPTALHEAVVVPEEEVLLHLLHRVQPDADDDQQPVPPSTPPRKGTPTASSSMNGKIAIEARKSEPGSEIRLSTRSMYSAVRAPGFTPGNEGALLLQVLRQVDRVEDDRGVEVREEDDQQPNET